MAPSPSDYRRVRSIAELRFYYVLNPASPYRERALRTIVEPACRALAVEYGITVEPLDHGTLPPHRPDGLTYVIYGPTNPLTMGAAEQAYLAALAADGNRTNLISAYPLTAAGEDRPDYARARTAVPDLCDALDVNAIFPDELDLTAGIRTNTWYDVYVNAIGETLRVKYHPTESTDADDRATLARLRDAYADDIAELARIHRKHRLWQRQPHTDGSVMFPRDGHWLTSQTVTDKTTLTPADFDLVTSFDEGSQSLTYTGERLPSSDAPEFLMLSGLLSRHDRRPGLIVHFHHRDLTRDPRYRELVSADRIEGGRFAAGRAFFRELRDRNSDWFIIREHGMVWVGESVAAFGEYVEEAVAG